MMQLLDTKTREGIFSQQRTQSIKQFVQDYIATDDVYAIADLSTQITQINYKLWPHYFVGNDIPQLIYLDVEMLTTQVRLRHVLSDTEHLHYKMLFDPAVRKIALESFDNIPGAFSTQEQWGTYFLWGLDTKGHRVRLSVQDDMLVSYDGSISL